jgi:plastocyanin
MRSIARALLPGLGLVALLSAGCGSGSSATTQAGAPTPGPGDNVHVAMKTLEFAPLEVHGKVGQKVMWTNEDSSPHNVTYVSGPKFTSSRVMEPGARFSIRLTAPGTIHYYCTLHPWMKATIVVSP